MTTTYDLPSRSLWFGLLAAPAAWGAHGLLGWFVGERTCSALTPGAVRWIVAVLTLVALAVSIWGAVHAWRLWRGLSRADDPLATEAVGRLEFMALAGFLVSTVFSLGIFWAGWSSAFLGDCGRMR